MKARVFRLVAMQLGWIACVTAAAAGVPSVGVAAVVLIVIVYLSVWMDGRRSLIGDSALILSAAGLGFALDSLLVVTGQMSFPEAARWGRPSTVWMTALWVNFAVGIGALPPGLVHSLGFAALLGALGGPLAYLAGQSIGAIELAPSTALVAIALQWAIATPLLFFLYQRFGRDPLTEDCAS